MSLGPIRERFKSVLIKANTLSHFFHLSFPNQNSCLEQFTANRPVWSVVSSDLNLTGMGSKQCIFSSLIREDNANEWRSVLNVYSLLQLLHVEIQITKAVDQRVMTDLVWLYPSLDIHFTVESFFIWCGFELFFCGCDMSVIYSCWPVKSCGSLNKMAHYFANAPLQTNTSNVLKANLLATKQTKWQNHSSHNT